MLMGARKTLLHSHGNTHGWVWSVILVRVISSRPSCCDPSFNGRALNVQCMPRSEKPGHEPIIVTKMTSNVLQVLISKEPTVAGRVAAHVADLEDELALLKQLDHPNIVRYLVRSLLTIASMFFTHVIWFRPQCAPHQVRLTTSTFINSKNDVALLSVAPMRASPPYICKYVVPTDYEAQPEITHCVS